jgi:murein DD-endopeptidase MepM/ murein hydrolase activator NlpD
VIQGNNTSADHNAADLNQKFAWDFRRPCGSPLLAARSGNVVYAIHSNDGFGKDSPNNQIQVLHPDGTVAVYLHLQQGSIPGNLFPTGGSTPAVTQGQQIAKVGCVGISLTGHVHFEVRQNRASPITSVQTVGVVFADVADDNGIPRTFGTYTSGNSKAP